MKNKKLVRKRKKQIFDHFRTFSQNFFDFLTSKNIFWSNVTNYKVVQNQIPYNSPFSNFFTTKIDENRFWADFQGNRLFSAFQENIL